VPSVSRTSVSRNGRRRPGRSGPPSVVSVRASLRCRARVVPRSGAGWHGRDDPRL